MESKKIDRISVLDYANTYNRAIKFLCRIYASKKKGSLDEEKVLRNNKRISMLIAEEPIWLLHNTGMYLLKHAIKIHNRDWKAILEMDFNEEKKIYKQSEDGSSPIHTEETMRGKIEFIKQVLMNSSQEEREIMMNKLGDMLSAYCQYAIHIKSVSH
jgi:hypothetical protein